MKFLTKVAISTLAALSVIGGEGYARTGHDPVLTPQQAQQARVSGENALSNIIYDIGYTTSVEPCYEDGVLGWHNRATKEIRVCSNRGLSNAEAWETFRHEAIHAAQRCVDPSMNTTVFNLEWLSQQNSAPYWWEHVTANYPRNKWAIELEAFIFMEYANSDVANIVRQACN